MGPLLILIMSPMGQHTTWAIPTGNTVRVGTTGCASCLLLLLLQGAAVGDTSVSKETLRLLFVSK